MLPAPVSPDMGPQFVHHDALCQDARLKTCPEPALIVQSLCQHTLVANNLNASGLYVILISCMLPVSLFTHTHQFSSFSLVMSPSEDFIRKVIGATPIMDNYARPLVKVDHVSERLLLSMVNEAHGGTLDESRMTFSHAKAVKQLADKLGCEHTWEAIENRVKTRIGQ